VDATCCRIMRIDPTLIPYLQMTEDNGQTGAARVHQIGEPVRAVQTEFRLIPMFGALRLRV